MVADHVSVLNQHIFRCRLIVNSPRTTTQALFIGLIKQLLHSEYGNKGLQRQCVPLRLDQMLFHIEECFRIDKACAYVAVIGIHHGLLGHVTVLFINQMTSLFDYRIRVCGLSVHIPFTVRKGFLKAGSIEHNGSKLRQRHFGFDVEGIHKVALLRDQLYENLFTVLRLGILRQLRFLVIEGGRANVLCFFRGRLSVSGLLLASA